MSEPKHESPHGGAEPLADAARQAARIHLLPPDLADQIAAGEVVERPASIVKELVDNAIDAGARRIEIELAGGGSERIVVVDDGTGIDAADLSLAITRHATSKLTSSADLVAPRWLGFRGEALASIAAVAKVVIETRTRQVDVGTRLVSLPGLAPTLEPCAQRGGTRIEITGLFANVPARRKFLRTPATELTHCIDVIAKLALVHAHAGFRARHEGRVVLDVAPSSVDARVAALLGQRAGDLVPHRGSYEGVEVALWIGEGDPERADVSVVVRQRVVRERAISQIVREAWWGSAAPCAAIFVEPPPGTVDVNVHPQKAEVRFSEPQRVYAAVRRAMAAAASTTRVPARASADAEPTAGREAGPHQPSVDEGEPRELFAAASPTESVPTEARPYALRTRATEADYATTRETLRRAAAGFAATFRDPAPEAETGARAADEAVVAAPTAPEVPELLDCLPGPIALMRWRDELLAVDLRELRGFILRRRIAAELGGRNGSLAAQALLVPAVVAVSADDAELLGASAAELETMGMIVDRFGDSAIVVRAIPATLRSCVDELDASALVGRVLPYLRMRARGNEPTDVASVLADCAPPTVAARFARGFMREALSFGVAVEALPGVRRWRPDELVAPRR